MGVVPNVCGISVFSPRLDRNGNSVRGVRVATELVRRIKMHNFEVFSGLAHTKIELKQPKYLAETNELSSIMFAASQGDAGALLTYYNSGSDLTRADYDGRTSLHLAATEGNLITLQFLIRKYSGNTSFLNGKDRWGATALKAARHYHHDKCVKALEKAGCTDESHDPDDDDHDDLDDTTISDPLMSSASSYPDFDTLHLNDYHVVISNDAPLLLSAAFHGDLDEVVKLHSSGIDIAIGDYDTRTALHLAACEGHLHICRYILVNFSSTDEPWKLVRARDRWGNCAVDDAIRYGHEECANFRNSFPSPLF